jgi:biopolymer transport protein ExbD
MKRSRESIGFDLTPLIDIIFLLLIFFLVSTVFKKDEQVLGLNLPETQNAEGKTTNEPKKTLTLELSSEKLALNGQEISMENFESELTKTANEAEKKPVDLKVDKNVNYERLVKILDLLKKYKMTDVSLITVSQ